MGIVQLLELYVFLRAFLIEWSYDLVLLIDTGCWDVYGLTPDSRDAKDD